MTENTEMEQMLETLPKEISPIGDPPLLEIQLPDQSLNNNKPDFTFISRNIYPTKMVTSGVPWDYGVSCSCSSTPGSSGVCGRDCRSGILMFSYSANPECDDSCLDVCIPFDQRPVKKMKLVQTEKCGFGVVSEEDIMQGEFIIEYVGEVIDYKTCEERLWRLKSQGETNFYFCEVNRQTVIDATYKGNMSRYMNHSCSPNAEMQKWTVDGETRMVIFASRDIKKGEHLTYDYKFMRFGADQDCYCGSLGCRAKLGVRPKKSNVSTDAAIKMVACQVAINTLEAKALLSGKKDKIEHSEMGQMLESLPKEFGKPVEIGLPDQLHKSKSNFTYISRNIYPIPTKKVKKRVQVEDDGIFCSCSSTLGSSGICGRDCHCGMLFSTCSSNCKCDESCPNIPFDQRPLKKLKLVQTEKCGSGVVADEDIMRGEFIIEYLGEVIDDKTCEERLWKMKDKGETNFYLCEVKHDMVIDATHKGNISRYINHSCSPNTEMQKWRIDGETRIAIFATRDIKKGESLNYDYRFVQFGADQDCHCGSLGCRTKLGVRPNKSNFSRPKKSKLPALDVAKKMVACQAAITLKANAVPSGRKDAYKNGVQQTGCSSSVTDHTNIPHDCVGQVLVIRKPGSNRLFGIIKRFDIGTRKHLILFEGGGVELLDLTQVDWELCNF